MTVNIGTLEGTITLKDQFTSVLGSVVGKMSAAGEQVSSLGRGLTSFGTILTASVTVPLTAAAGSSIKFATDFESSFTGVMKTVEGSGDQFGELAQILRDMAAGDDPIPIDINELNAIAEAAGQLGIETAHIADFTRVMADMGVTTNLSSTTAASSLARLANITGMSQDAFSNLGSTIVDLGNNFATTEQEIVDMSLRVAGAGTTIGFTEGQILAVSTAMSSLGIRSEQGGSAFSRVLNDMALSVAVGGDAVALFASVAGMSIDQFVEKFQTDAAGAVEAFIIGLGQMQESGGPLLQVLEELGFGGIRVRDVLTRLAGGSDLVVEALDRQETAWSENTALTKEAELRYKTFHSQLTIFWNRLKDVGITIGQAVIPILTSMLNAMTPVLGVVARMAEGFGNLWTPLQVIILGLGALVAAIGPAMVFFGQLIFAAGQLAIAWGVLGSSTLVATLIPAIKGFLATLFGPVGLIAAGVILLATWKPVREFLVDLATGAFELVKSSIEAIIERVVLWWESTEELREFLVALVKVIVVDLVRALDEVITQIVRFGRFIRTQMIDPVNRIVALFAGWVRNSEFVRVAINTVRVSVQSMVRWVRTAIRVWREWIESLGGILNVLSRIIPGFETAVRVWREWIDKAKALTVELDDSAESMDDLADSTVTVNTELDQSIPKVILLKSSLDSLKGSFDGLPISLVTVKEDFSELNTTIDLTTQAHEVLGQIVRLTADDLHLLGGLVSEYNRLAQQGADVTREQLTQALEGMRAAIEANQRSWDEWARTITDVLFDIVSGTRSFGDVLKDILVNQAKKWINTFVTNFIAGFAQAQSAGQGFWSSLVSGAQGGTQAVGGLTAALGAAVVVFAAVIIGAKELVKDSRNLDLQLQDLFKTFADGAGTMGDFHRITELIVHQLNSAADGSISLSMAQATLNQNFSNFVIVAREFGEAGTAAIAQVVTAAQQAGADMGIVAEELRKVYTEAFELLEDRAQFILDQVSNLADGLITFLGDITNASVDQIEFAGESIVQAFAMMVEAGASFSQIAAELGPLFGDIEARGLQLGLTMGEEFTRIGEMLVIMADEHVQRAIEKIEGMNAVMVALGNVGLVTQGQFEKFASQIIATINLLQQEGLTAQEAYAQVQGPLQQLMDLGQTHNLQINDTIAALLNEADAMGVVTDRGLTMEDILIRGFDMMIEAINRLIIAMGGVPVEFTRWTDDLNDMAGGFGDTMGGMGDTVDDVLGNFRDGWRNWTNRAVSDTAAAAGVIGETWAGAASVVRESFTVIADGSEISAASVVDSWTNASGDIVDSVATMSDIIRDSLSNIPVTFDVGDIDVPHVPDRTPGFISGSGGFQNFGTGTVAMLHGTEQVLTQDEGASVAAMVGSAIKAAQRDDGGTGGGSTSRGRSKTDMALALRKQNSLLETIAIATTQNANETRLLSNRLASLEARKRTGP